MVRKNLQDIFQCKNICILGISRKENSLSYQVLKNIVDCNFHGDIYLINPNKGEVLGKPLLRDIDNVEAHIDLVLNFLPFNLVNENVEKFAKKGCKNFIIYSSGFSEMKESGKERSDYLKAVIEKYNLNVIGPNCIGIINNYHNLAASNWFYTFKKGSIAFVSQSGAYGMILSYMAKNRKIGFSKFISLGNCLDVDVSDILEYLQDDSDTKVIMLYAEGISDGKRFLDTARRVSKKKPILMVKAGKTLEGKKASKTHTGSIEIDTDIFKSACRSAGIVLVDSVDELIETAYYLEHNNIPNKNEIMVISPSGGPCIIAADNCTENNIKLIDPDIKTKEIIKKYVPVFASVSNPLDITTLTDNEHNYEIIKVLSDDKNIDVILLMVFTNFMSSDFKKSIKYIKKKKKNLAVVTLEEEKLYSEFEKLDVPVYFSVEKALKVIGYVCKYNELENKLSEEYSLQDEKFAISNIKINNSITGMLSESKSKKLLKLYGINIENEFVVNDGAELKKIYELLKKPLCVKVDNKSIFHKTAVGGVLLNVSDYMIAENALNSWKKRFGNDTGLIINEMIKKDFELFIGIKKDAVFGYVLIIGMGGVYVESINERHVELIPKNKLQLQRIIDEKILIKYSHIFEDNTEILRKKLYKLLENLITIVKMNKQIEELEINPLIISNKEIYIADALIKI